MVKQNIPENIKRILNKNNNFSEISGAATIQTKEKLDRIEKEVIELHRKIILLL